MGLQKAEIHGYHPAGIAGGGLCVSYLSDVYEKINDKQVDNRYQWYQNISDVT